MWPNLRWESHITYILIPNPKTRFGISNDRNNYTLLSIIYGRGVYFFKRIS